MYQIIGTISHKSVSDADVQVQTDIESQQQEQLNSEEEDINIGTSHQSTERWEVVDEYLNESQTQDDINVTNDSNSEERVDYQVYKCCGPLLAICSPSAPSP